MSTNSLHFQPGGALNAGAFYIERAADSALFDALLAGELCYVLASRQIGKSSLRARTQMRLQSAGVRCATIDLTTIGTVSSEDEWYASLVGELADQLLLGNPSVFWKEHAAHTPVYRFTRYLRDEVLVKIPGPVILFFDEIDLLRRVSICGEDFLASLRATYNQRADDTIYRRLGICLIGVATPGELIEDPNRTPFNVGRAITLDDFSLTEALAFLSGLRTSGECEEWDRQFLESVYRWTDGHPYLMQRLCAAVLEIKRCKNSQIWGNANTIVDELVEQIFPTAQADPNLSYAEIRFIDVHAPVSMAQKVSLYRRLLLGDTVLADRHSRLHSELRLAGLIKDVARPGNSESVLQIRNAIVARVFDREWLRIRSANAQLADALVRWKDAGRSDDLLLRGQALDEGLAASEGRESESDEAEFLRASLARRQNDEMERRRQAEARSQLLRRGVIVLSMLMTGLLASLLLAFYQTGLARKAQHDAESSFQRESLAKHSAQSALTEAEQQKDHAEQEKQHAKFAASRAIAAEQKEREARERAEQQEARARVEATRARSAEAKERVVRAQALSLADQIFSIADRGLEDVPGNAELRKNMLDATRELMDRLISSNKGQAIELYGKALVYIRNGDMAASQLRISDARFNYVLAHRIIEQIAKQEPSYQDMLFNSYKRLGDVALAVQDSSVAQKNFEEALKIAEHRALLSKSATVQSNLSTVLKRLGELAQARGDLNLAEDFFQRELQVTERSTQADPSPASQGVLSASLVRLGVLAQNREQMDIAQNYFARDLEITRQRADLDPSSSAQIALSESLLRLGRLAQTQKKLELAERYFERELALVKKRADVDPSLSIHNRLIRSLERLSNLARSNKKYEKAQRYLEILLEVTEKRAQSNPLSTAQKDILDLLWRLGDLAEDRGRLADAQHYYERLFQVAERRAQADPSESAQRSLAFSLWKLGDTAKARGQLAQVQKIYEKHLQLIEHRLHNNASSGLGDDLVKTLGELANLAKERGQPKEAEQYYERQLQIVTDRAQADSSADAQQAVSTTLESLGKLAQETGQIKKARSYFERQLEIEERLSSLNANPEYKKELAASLRRVGSLAKAHGQTNIAQANLERELQITEQLVKSDSSADAQRRLANILGELGQLASDMGKMDTAQGYIERELKATEKRAQLDPSTSPQYALLDVLDRLGLMEVRRNYLALGQRHFEQRLQVAERLVDANPTVTAQYSLGLSAERLGMVAEARNKPFVALQYYERSLHIYEKCTQADPSHQNAQRARIYDRLRLANIYIKESQRKAASAHLATAASLLKQLKKGSFSNVGMLAWDEDYLNRLQKKIAALR